MLHPTGQPQFTSFVTPLPQDLLPPAYPTYAPGAPMTSTLSQGYTQRAARQPQPASSVNPPPHDLSPTALSFHPPGAPTMRLPFHRDIIRAAGHPQPARFTTPRPQALSARAPAFTPSHAPGPPTTSGPSQGDTSGHQERQRHIEEPYPDATRLTGSQSIDQTPGRPHRRRTRGLQQRRNTTLPAQTAKDIHKEPNVPET